VRDGDRRRLVWKITRLFAWRVLTQRATRLAHDAGLDVAPLGKIPHLKTPGLLVMDMDSTAIQIECIDEIAKLAAAASWWRKSPNVRCVASWTSPPA
jgi:hypothetical protein